MPWLARLAAYRQPGGPSRFIASNLTFLAERERNLVPAVEQAFAVEPVDRKGGLESAGTNTLRGQVNGDLHARLLGCEADQLRNLRLRELDRKQAAAKTVALEDVAERRRDHRPEAGVE